MSKFTSRERVYLAANHEESDRVPIAFGACVGCGIVECPPYGRSCSALYEYLDIRDTKPLKIANWANGVWNIDYRLRERLHTDMLPVFSRIPPAHMESDGTKVWDSFYGLKIRKVGLHDDIVNFPLENATAIEEINGYMYWPDKNLNITEGVVDYAREIREKTDKFIIGINFFDFFPFMGYAFLSSRTKWLTDIRVRPKFYHQFAQRMLETTLALDSQFYQAVGPYVDGAQIFDDMGNEAGPFLSPADYREFCKPYTAEIIRNIRKYIRPEAKIVMHSCGSVYELIPDFIDMGVDILHGLQPLARDMAPYRLKEEFGNKICLMGGLDIQKLLPLGKPEQIREGVRRLLGAYAPGGGYIFAPAHDIEPDSPAPNIVAAYDAAYELGRYPISSLPGNGYVDFIRSLNGAKKTGIL
jgi:uroporphyrinogen decarboxylase